ncbi:hypothetical protein V8F33_005256 [Rhypophila sp. PSN 637]
MCGVFWLVMISFGLWSFSVHWGGGILHGRRCLAQGAKDDHILGSSYLLSFLFFSWRFWGGRVYLIGAFCLSLHLDTDLSIGLSGTPLRRLDRTGIVYTKGTGKVEANHLVIHSLGGQPLT